MSAVLTAVELRLRSPRQQIRSKIDYSKFLLAREWPFALSLAGVLLAVVTLLPTPVGIALSLVAFVLGLVTLTHDTLDLRRRRSEYQFLPMLSPFPTADYPPPAVYPSATYLFFPSRGTALVSDAIDSHLRTNPVEVAMDEDPYRLPTSLLSVAPSALRALNHGRTVFNGEIVGLRGDPIPPTGEAGPLRLQRTRFFDGQCSNELFVLREIQHEAHDDWDLRRTELADASGHLATLAESRLANGIGISTIAITLDGQIAVIRQSSRNIASPGLLAPSGSGSLEPKDTIRADHTADTSLHGVLETGMERELCEEASVLPTEIIRTDIVGFARWMERGARPEFFGVTHVSVSAATLLSRRPTASEQVYTKGTRIVEIDLPTLREELADGTDLLSAKSLPALVRDSGSLPLLLNIRAAAMAGTGTNQQPVKSV